MTSGGQFLLKDNVRRWMGCKNPPWSNKQLAQAVGVDEGYVSQVFRGRKSPSWGFLRKLAELTRLHDGGELIYYHPDGARRRGASQRNSKDRKGAKTR